MTQHTETTRSPKPASRRAARDGRRTGAMFAAAALLIASCGGGDDDASPATARATETTSASSTAPTSDTTEAAPSTTEAASPTTAPASSPTSEPDSSTTIPAAGSVVVTSADGNLTLTVATADAERVNPSIRILDPSEWPAELGDADQLPGVTIYEMEPDGAQFDEPVTVTRRLDVASFGASVGALAVPIVVPFTQEDDGQFVPLDNLEVTRFGSSLYASGTTTHFSPLGTIDLGMNVVFPGSPVGAGPAIPEIDDEFYADLAASYDFNDDLPIMAGVSDILGGAEPEVVSRRANPPAGHPFFGTIEVEEAVRTSPTQSAEEDAASLFRMLSASDEVPSSQLFAKEGVDVPEELRVVVVQYLLTKPGAERDRLKAIADDLAAGACLRWEVVHNPLFAFPSYSRIELTKAPELEEGEQLFAALYTGEFGPNAQLIDLAEMKETADGYGADVGLTSYGDVNQAWIVTTDDAGVAEAASNRERFESFFNLPGDIMMLFLPEPFTVDANEGVLFDGDVEFQIYDGR